MPDQTTDASAFMVYIMSGISTSITFIPRVCIPRCNDHSKGNTVGETGFYSTAESAH